MPKLSIPLLVALALLYPISPPTFAADSSAKSGGDSTYKVTIVFKSKATLNFSFASGTLPSIMQDLENPLKSPIRRYSYQSKTTNGHISVDLREVAAAAVEETQ